MKYTDYKFWYIKRDDNGFITEVAVRFYEGEYQTIDGKEKYVRTKRLETLKDLKHLAKKVNGKESIKGLIDKALKPEGEVAVVYLQEDFGEIKTDDDLRTFLNKEINKDKSRKVIKEQKI